MRESKSMTDLLLLLLLLLLLQPALTWKDNPVLTLVYSIITIIKQHENILKTSYLPSSEKRTKTIYIKKSKKICHVF